MGNIMPVIHTLDGPALMYACHQYQKNKHEVLEVIVQNQQTNKQKSHEPTKSYVGYEITSEHFSASVLK
jgi:hypothetical protein